MKNYVLKRLLLIPLTLIGILTINFIIIQFAPGGPIEHTLAKYQGMNVDSKAQIAGSITAELGTKTKYQGTQGVPDDLVKELEKQFGFDKPAYYRFGKMLVDYARFDFGKSFYQDKTVGKLIWERMPVSISQIGRAHV